MRILVGITGGVAAYKAAEVIRELTELGHQVRVVPTKNALQFIGVSTLEALSHNSVHSDLFDEVENVRHIELAQWAELVVVAPATASFLARTAAGIADDLLGNIVLATKAPIAIYPAMHTEMWENSATQHNVKLLRERGLLISDPAVGRLTGNDTGVGRLPDAHFIAQSALSRVVVQDLTGKSVLIVAGGTREPIDPVRFIGNRSSGKQGIALVEAAIARGAKVSMIAANLNFYIPGVDLVNVSSTSELLSAVDRLSKPFDFIVMPAAVSDYRVANSSETKIKKSEVGAELSLRLVENPDVIVKLANSARKINSHVKVVGFAAETHSGEALVRTALEKLSKKGLDFVVANEVSHTKGFDSDSNDVVIVGKDAATAFSGTKLEIANSLFDLLIQ